MRAIITLAATLMMTACSGVNDSRLLNSLPDTLQVGQSILSRDTVEQVAYPTLTQEQLDVITRQMSLDMPQGTQLIGVRPAGNGFTLEAYKIPTGEHPNLFKVYLATRNSKDAIVDAIDLGEFHTSEHQKPLRFGGNRYYNTDAELRFDGDRHIVLHRVLTFTSLFLKDHTLTELWRVEWDNNYEIDAHGQIIFQTQQETYRHPADIDDPTIDQYKSRDLPGSK